MTKEQLAERGIGFRPGDVVVIEAARPISQAAAEAFAMYARALYDETGVRFVILDSDLKVSNAHRPVDDTKRCPNCTLPLETGKTVCSLCGPVIEETPPHP